MKVLHLTVVRVLYSGQRRQLALEHKLGNDLNEVEWSVLALHTEAPRGDFERQIPRPFRHTMLVRLYGWLYLLLNARHYDLVLVRDMSLDLFGPVLGWFVRNRVTVHHAKMADELGVLEGRHGRRIAVGIEKLLKPVTLKSALGNVGVTQEIAVHAASASRNNTRVAVYPNGMLLDDTNAPYGDRRDHDVVNVVFMCSEFSEWHGLDLLLDSLKTCLHEGCPPYALHLVGNLNQTQQVGVERLREYGFPVEAHGTLDAHDIASLLSHADIGLGSLALHRKGLAEASTLKVREYLAAGVPVYATHRDTAFPVDFPYFRNDHDGVSVARVLEFGRAMKRVSREAVRCAARPYIDKKAMMSRMSTTLGHWLDRQ